MHGFFLQSRDTVRSSFVVCAKKALIMHFRYIFFLGLIDLFGSSAENTLFAGPRATNSSQSKQAQNIIQNLFGRANKIINNKRLDVAGKKRQMQQLARQAFDIDYIAQWLLPSQVWRAMSSNQRNRFINIAIVYMVDSFYRFAPKYLNDLKIDRAVPLGRNNTDQGFEVYAKVPQTESYKPIQVRIKINKGKIRNMLVENVDALNVKKGEYQKIWVNEHRNVDNFLKKLEEVMKSQAKRSQSRKAS